MKQKPLPIKRARPLTPRAAATASTQIIDIEKTDHCLDPARGGGAFYDQFACGMVWVLVQRRQ